jgi:signal transduction histidine kinase
MQQNLIVRDEGAGIPAGQRDLMFQRFWRGDRRSNGSAGLGLSIVARVVSAHGGSIAVADAPVRGLAFSIKLRPTALRPPDASERNGGS